MARFTTVIASLAALAAQAVAVEECNWPGHCLGDVCTTYDDCANDYICVAGACNALSGQETCSWEGHCIGASCQTNDECSDDLICHPEQNGCIVPGAIEADKWPFYLDLSCYEETVSSECSDEDDEDECDPCEDVTVQLLQVAGEHFNVGYDNINIEVLRQSTGEMLFNATVDALAAEGKLGGYFEAKTNVECPTTEADKLTVYGYDVLSQKYRGQWFWVGQNDQ